MCGRQIKFINCIPPKKPKLSAKLSTCKLPSDSQGDSAQKTVLRTRKVKAKRQKTIRYTVAFGKREQPSAAASTN